MKKIITLLLSIGAFATSFAQYNHQSDDRNKIKNDQQYVITNTYDRGNDNRRFDDTYVFTAQQKDFEIQKINREFDSKINSVKGRIFMGRRQKMEMIQSLERERSQQIQIVYAKFSDRKNKFSAYNDRDKDRRNDWKH